MISDDLAGLLSRPANGTGVQLRQGVVQSWDSDTGSNTITVAGGTLVNLPSLSGESMALQVGDVVALLTAGDRVCVLGKVTNPGDPGTVPTWAADISALGDTVQTISTVTIPAIQSDVTVVQGDVVDLGTDVSTAQSTADTAVTNAATAQSTADGAASTASAAASAAATAQAGVDALQTDLDAAEADVAAAQADIATLTGTTIPGLSSDIADVAADVATAQADVDAILPITETKIADDAITTPKIAALAVTTALLAAGAVTASKIAAGTITATEIAAGAITTAKIAAGAVTTTELAAGAVTAAKIAAGTITATEIAAGAITAAKLDAAAITGKTITGGLFRTATSGNRIEIDSTAANQIRFASGNANETAPGVLFSRVLPGFTTFSEVRLVVPELLGTADGWVAITNDSMTGDTEVNLNADIVQVFGGFNVDATSGFPQTISMAGNDFIFNGSDVVTDDDTQTLTNKTVAYANNTFTFPQPARSLSATDILGISSTSFVPGSPVVGTAFTAPPSGSVYITVSGHLESNAASNFGYLAFEVRAGSSVGSGSVFHAANTDEGIMAGSAASGVTRSCAGNRYLLTGLTPGSSYNVQTVHLVTTGTLDVFYRSVLVEPVL
ncbi:hypothetical protein [Kribbella jiaozuonensis]|uniref:DUF1983 domain-containing protein n=1 Tax=Kribbella jiaozuonensis TaxID=2575441 RepID=A0A4V5UX36_9ACTN|nr:hypothetical protein [Kribbella jiaozuonensis]TKK79193.1 hypothetical protein FDA38_12245 [Kribbella jiaozuonensis]TKK83263.1 hypothetical protein FDA38_11200 [Kribbella jiaozuonensis]